MTIVYALRNLEGGIRRHVIALIEGAVRAGHTVYLITDFTQADQNARLWAQPGERFHLIDIGIKSAPGPWDIRTLLLARQALRKLGAKPDVIHGHGAKGGIIARVLALGLRCRSAYTPHGGSIHAMHGAFLNFFYVAVERLLVPVTDRLIFESPYSMDEFAKRVTDASNKAVLNVNGIPEVTPDLSPWPRSLGSSADPLRLAAFGLLRPIKGFDTLIDALSELRKSGVLFSAAIFGEGSERASLEAKVRDLGLSHCVRLPGETADTLYEMRLAHIVVQPSQFESFGLVTLEAQALGRAVIATNVGGLKHLITDGATGLLVEPNSPTQIKEAIRRILNNPDAALEMRKSAADQAREYYSETAMVNGALSIYESLCPKETR